MLSLSPGRGPWNWWGATGCWELPGTQCPTLLLALGSCELLMSIRRKDGSWNSFTRQSYHNGGWIQLQPDAGFYALQHQPEQVPASACAYVSIAAAACVLGCSCAERESCCWRSGLQAGAIARSPANRQNGFQISDVVQVRNAAPSPPGGDSSCLSAVPLVPPSETSRFTDLTLTCLRDPLL